MSHTFYNTHRLSKQTKLDILNEAITNSKSIKVDMLDTNISWSRVPVDKTVDDIMKLFKDEYHFVVIHRSSPFGEEYGEFGFTTNGNPAYYLWVFTKLDTFEKIIKKYDLKEL
jgi:hypothetical protein